MVILYISVVLLFYVFHLYCKNKYSFWTIKGVKGPAPSPLVGNFGKILIMKENQQELLQNIYEKYSNEKIVGLYRGFTPILLLRDPELIKQILIKDFLIFQDRDGLSRRSKLSKNLFEADGYIWRILRQKLTPVFTSKKLKDMAPLIEECVDNYNKYVEHLVENNINHEIKSLKSKYTLQVIGSCAFGLQLDTFNDQEDEFRIMAKKVFNPSTMTKAMILLEMIIPGIRTLFNTASDVQNFFFNVVSNIIKQRENEPMKRKDFMDLMIELKEEGRVSRRSENGISEIEMNDELIAAQAFVFYAAGFETSSTAMSYMIHELALNQDVQNKVFKEICSVSEKYNGKIDYESIKEMSYLELVFKETLRKHTLVHLIRKSTTNYVLPGTDVTIPKGTRVIVSVSGLHRDKKYYEHPEKFYPEHFSPEKISVRPHCTYLPFGDGPRNCIGMRFATLQSLMGLAAFLRKFKVEPSAKTKTSLQYNPKSLISESKDGIWVKILKR